MKSLFPKRYCFSEQFLNLPRIYSLSSFSFCFSFLPFIFFFIIFPFLFSLIFWTFFNVYYVPHHELNAFKPSSFFSVNSFMARSIFESSSMCLGGGKGVTFNRYFPMTKWKILFMLTRWYKIKLKSSRGWVDCPSQIRRCSWSEKQPMPKLHIT